MTPEGIAAALRSHPRSANRACGRRTETGGECTCSGPVSNKDTRKSLCRRDGGKASLGDFDDSSHIPVV